MTTPMMVREYQPRSRDMGQTAGPIRLAAEPWATDAKPREAITRPRAKSLEQRKAAVVQYLYNLPPGATMSAKGIAQHIEDPEMRSFSSLLTSLWREGLITRARIPNGSNWLVVYGVTKQ